MRRVVHRVRRLCHGLLPVLVFVAFVQVLSPRVALGAGIPPGWPQHLALGVADSPGDAQTLRAQSGVDMRYQYLAGGVNTGHGWATWNPDGSFVTMYVRESLAAHIIPVFTYYQMLQSAPSVGATEQARDLSNMRNPATMQAYWADYELLLRRVAQSAGRHLVVIHVEPDLWGYLEQAHATALARSFAQRLIALRDRLAPHVLLAYHLSVWGTDRDITNSKPSPAEVDQHGGDVGCLLRIAPRPFRPGVQRRDRSRRRLLPVRRGQPEHLVGAGRLRPRESLHRRLHAAHPHRAWCSGSFRSGTAI